MSTVSPGERPTWEVWRAKLRQVLGEASRRPGSQPEERWVGFVFRKERPVLLHATPASVAARCRDRDTISLQALYPGSGVAMRGPCRSLAADHPEGEAAPERRFRPVPLAALGGSDKCLFLLDDNRFVAPFSLREQAGALNRHLRTIGVWFCLGRNR